MNIDLLPPGIHSLACKKATFCINDFLWRPSWQEFPVAVLNANVFPRGGPRLTSGSHKDLVKGSRYASSALP